MMRMAVEFIVAAFAIASIWAWAEIGFLMQGGLLP